MPIGDRFSGLMVDRADDALGADFERPFGRDSRVALIFGDFMPANRATTVAIEVGRYRTGDGGATGRPA